MKDLGLEGKITGEKASKKSVQGNSWIELCFMSSSPTYNFKSYLKNIAPSLSCVCVRVCVFAIVGPETTEDGLRYRQR